VTPTPAPALALAAALLAGAAAPAGPTAPPTIRPVLCLGMMRALRTSVEEIIDTPFNLVSVPPTNAAPDPHTII
jgi:hypothetical protein